MDYRFSSRRFPNIKLQFQEFKKYHSIQKIQEQKNRQIVKPTIEIVNKIKDLCINVEELEFSPATKWLFRQVLQCSTSLEKQIYFNRVSLRHFRNRFDRRLGVLHLMLEGLAEGIYDDIMEKYYLQVKIEITYLQDILFLFTARFLKSLKYLFIQKRSTFSEEARSYYKTFLEKEYDLWSKCLAQSNYYRYRFANKIRENIKQKREYIEAVSMEKYITNKDIQEEYFYLRKVTINSINQLLQIKHSQSLLDQNRSQFAQILLYLTKYKIRSVENQRQLFLLHAVTQSIIALLKGMSLNPIKTGNKRQLFVSIHQLERYVLNQQNDFILYLRNKPLKQKIKKANKNQIKSKNESKK